MKGMTMNDKTKKYVQGYLNTFVGDETLATIKNINGGYYVFDQDITNAIKVALNFYLENYEKESGGCEK